MMPREKIHRLIFLLAMISIVVSLPFSIMWCSWSIIILTLNWLLEGDMNHKWAIFKRSPIVWLFIGFYIIHIPGLLYTSDFANGVFNLEKKLSLLIFPLVLATSKVFERKQLTQIFHFFIAACFFAVLICLAASIISKPTNPILINFDVFNASKYHSSNPNEFWSLISYVGLGSIIGLHPTYFSLYIAFAIILVTNLHLENLPLYPFSKKLVIVLTVVVLTIGLILLSSRIVILAFFLLSSFWLFRLFSSKHRYLKGVLSCFALGGLFLLMIYVNPVSRFRVIEEPLNTALKYPESSQDWNSWNLRLVEWNSSLKIIMKDPLMGVGTGDAVQVLSKEYSMVNLGLFDLGFNSHNQYLQTGVMLGFIGIAWLLSAFIWPTRCSFKSGDKLYLVFIFLFSVCCLTESMLESQKGIVFYGFFNSLILFHWLPKKSTNNA